MKKQEEINHLLEKHFPTKNYGSTIREHILEYTEDVVKLFAIPDVIKSVCACPDKGDCAGYGAVGERACIACKDNKQTGL